MAAIGRRSVLALLAAAGVGRAGDNDPDALAIVNRFTTALSNGDADGAIDVFDQNCPGYETLSQYFVALTGSFAITNEVDVVDEEKGTMTLDWTLTLRSLSTEETVRREKQVTLDVARRKNAWKIVRFSPVDLFNPQV